MCITHCGLRLFIHLSCSAVGSYSAQAGLYIQLSDKQVGGTDEVWGGYGPRQMNSHLDWRWPLCASQHCCCSDTSLLHSNVWSEEKGTGGSDHHSAQLPCHRLPTLMPNINWTESDLTLNTSQLSLGWEENKLWGGGERYCRWLGGVWVKDRTRQFTC